MGQQQQQIQVVEGSHDVVLRTPRIIPRTRSLGMICGMLPSKCKNCGRNHEGKISFWATATNGPDHYSPVDWITDTRFSSAPEFQTPLDSFVSTIIIVMVIIHATLEKA